MKNTLNHSRIIYFTRAAVFSLCLVASGCQPANGQEHPKPLLIIIGGDVSSSLTSDELLDTTHIRHICLSLETSGKGGTVAFDAIGNVSARKLLRCAIQSNRPIDRTLPPTRRKEAEKKWQEVRKKNVHAINVFVDSCHRRMTVPLQSNTDLNGFFNKVNKLCSEPQFTNHEKIVFVNTDMQHDVGKKPKKDTVLRCQLPTGVQLWVAGAEDSKGFQAKYSFESPNGVTDFFRQQLNSSKKNGK